MESAFKILRSQIDKSITLLPEGKASFSLIWMHGLGDSPQGFLDYFLHTKQSPLNQSIRIKLLQAPIRKVTANGGMKMTSWYDIKQFNNWKKQEDIYNVEEVKDSLKIIDGHVQTQAQELKKIYPNDNESIYKRIFIGGFSQGSAMSICYGLTANKIIGGIIGFSGHCISLIPLINLGKIPMIIFHGQKDELLNCNTVMQGYKKLKFNQYQNIKIVLRPQLQHSVDLYQLSKATQWIKEIRPKI